MEQLFSSAGPVGMKRKGFLAAFILGLEFGIALGPCTFAYMAPMIGKVQITQTVRPGFISFALGFGHWATGASDVEIDGEIIKGEQRRAAGLNANAAMWIDSTLKNTCFLDPVGGSVSFYDTHVRLEKV